MGKDRSRENITEIAALAAEVALQRYKEEERQKARKGRVHNTELLLKNYKKLSSHLKNAIDDINSIDSNLVFLDEDGLYIAAIRRSKAKTLIMLSHIDAALAILENEMKEKGQSDKVRVIKALYIDEEAKTFERLAEDLHCTEMTVRRWKNEMMEQLSVLIFGVDGLRLSV